MVLKVIITFGDVLSVLIPCTDESMLVETLIQRAEEHYKEASVRIYNIVYMCM